MATQTLNRIQNRQIEKGKNIALWVLQIVTAAVFLMAGFSKLTGDPRMVEMYSSIGLGQWFRYFTGFIEVFSAILLLTATFAGLGALLLTATMIGAIITHLFVIGGNPTMPFVLLVLNLIILYGRRARTNELVQRLRTI